MEQDYSEILIFQQKGKNMTTKTTRRYPQSHLSRVSMDQAVRQPGTSMSAHHCHNYYEMYYVEQGSCRFMINDSFQDLCQGDCMLIPPQVFHYSRYINESCLRSNVYFRSEDIGELAMSFLPGGGAFFSQVQMFHVPEASQPQIHALLESMARELFGTRVRLDGTTESGKITLFYYNSDDLQRIWDVIEMAREK